MVGFQRRKLLPTSPNTLLTELPFCFAGSPVPRDWSKVTNYCKRLGIIDATFVPNMTNNYLSWDVDPQDNVDPDFKQKEIAVYQAQEAHKLLASAVPRTLPAFGCKHSKASVVQASA